MGLKKKKAEEVALTKCFGTMVIGWLCFTFLMGCMVDSEELGGHRFLEGQGLVRVSIAGEEISRTLMPQNSSFTKHSLLFECTSDSTNPNVSETFTESPIINKEVGLELGTWRLTVTGYTTLSGVERVAARGTAEITINAGSITDVSVNTTPIIPGSAEAAGTKGIFTYKIAFPADVDINHEETNIQFSPVGLGTSQTIRGLKNNIPTSVEVDPGYYDVIITLTKNDGGTTGLYTGVYIYPGLETKTEPEADYVFTDTDFVSKRYLGGRVNIIKPSEMTLTEITVKAYRDPGRTTPISPGGVFTGIGTVVNWYLSIPIAEPKVYFKLTAKDSANQTFELNTGETPGVIPENGKADIDLAMTIHRISNYTGAKGIVTASKTAGVLGETITITGSPAANYTLTSMKMNGSEVSGMGNTRTFAMPDQDVSLNGEFKSTNADLRQFILKSEEGFSFDFDSIPSKIRVPSINVPNPQITLIATPVNEDATVTYRKRPDGTTQSSGTFTLLGTDETSFEIIITSEAGNPTRTYLITVELFALLLTP